MAKFEARAINEAQSREAYLDALSKSALKRSESMSISYSDKSSQNGVARRQSDKEPANASSIYTTSYSPLKLEPAAMCPPNDFYKLVEYSAAQKSKHYI